MLTTEHYYNILDYSKTHLEGVAKLSKHREQLHRPGFLESRHSCLIGEKGVGKTILICQKALSQFNNDVAKILYVSLDDTIFAGLTMFDIASAAEQRGVEIVIFDEVHRYTTWKSDLKSIIDRLKIATIISGSSILSFTNLGGLSRRIVKYELKGLSFREYLNLIHNFNIPGISLSQIVDTHKTQISVVREEVEKATNTPIIALFEDYLQRGYYTYSLQHKNTSDFLQTLRQATEDTIAYEIVIAQTHSRPDMSRKLQALFKAIAQNVPYTVNYKFLQEYTHISDLRTLKHYLACLEQAGIICSMERKTLKSLRKAEKIYLGNPSLYFAYANLHPNFGSIRETFFINSMRLAEIDTYLHHGSADFIAESYSFEIGGPSKTKRQIKDERLAFIVKDTAEISSDPQILPLWAFGFLTKHKH